MIFGVQIAMLGGKVAENATPGGGAAARGPSTKPMEVSEFLNKGVGGAALPRRAQVNDFTDGLLSFSDFSVPV